VKFLILLYLSNETLKTISFFYVRKIPVPVSAELRFSSTASSTWRLAPSDGVIFPQNVGRTNLIMPPLPKLDLAVEKQLWSNPHCISAYRVYLKYEEELSEDKRCPIFLLLYTTQEEVRVYLAESIFSCNDDPENLVISTYGEMCPVMKYRGRAPATSTHPSRYPFAQHWQDMKAKITEALKDANNWGCVVTGHVQYGAPDEVILGIEGNSLVHGCNTKCAHIIPEATFFNVKEKSQKVCGY